MRNNEQWLQYRKNFQSDLDAGKIEPVAIRSFVSQHDIDLDHLGFLSLLNLAALHSLRHGKMFDVESVINDFSRFSEASIRATVSRAVKLIAKSYCPVTDFQLTHIDDRITLGDELYRDSSGIVYQATSAELNQNLEVKLLFPGAGPIPVPLKVLKKIGHPGISKLIEFGTVKGMNFLVRERPDGKPLQLLCKYPSRIDIRKCVEIFCKLLNAVDHCHCIGLVFRVIRSENIIVRNQEPIISNFELSLSMNNPGTDDSTDSNLGYEFVSPVAQDLFSLGVLLYEMLTGFHPFRFDSDGKYFRYPSEYRDEIDNELETICLNAISDIPHARFKSARQFRYSLATWYERTYHQQLRDTEEARTVVE